MAMECDWIVDHGAYSEFGDLLTLSGRAVHRRRLRHPQHPRAGRTSCTNHALGLGVPRLRLAAGFLASESLMDELAEKLGIDPLEFRYLNVYRAGRHDADRPGSPTCTAARDVRHDAPQLPGRAGAGAAESTADEEAASASPAASTLRPRRGRRWPEADIELDPDGGVTVVQHLGGPRPGRRHRHPVHGARGPAPAGHGARADPPRT